jgi:hypothetical protein
MNAPTTTTTPENIKKETDAEIAQELSGGLYQNWGEDGEPPIMVNPNASVHHKIAWAWGQVSLINSMLMDICADGGKERGALAGTIISHLTPVEGMLQHLGDSTCKVPSART